MCLFRPNILSNCLSQKRHLRAFDAFDVPVDDGCFLVKLWKLFVCTLSCNSLLNVFLHCRHLKAFASDEELVKRTSAGRRNSPALLDVAVDVDVAGIFTKIEVRGFEFVGGIDSADDVLVVVASLLATVASDFADCR